MSKNQDSLNAKERCYLRRAAQVLGVAVPDYAALKYPPRRDEYPIEYDDYRHPILSEGDLTAVRHLVRTLGLEMPVWAVPRKPGRIKGLATKPERQCSKFAEYHGGY